MIRVFVVHENAISETTHFSDMTDDEFMDVADSYSLLEFQHAFNEYEVNDNHVIRFIYVKEDHSFNLLKRVRSQLSKKS